MTTFVQLLMVGITMGSLYVLLALGWVLVYRVSGIVFLIAGEFVVFGALATISLSNAGIPLVLAVSIAILGALVFAFGVDLLLRFLPNMPHAASVLLMLGLAMLSGEAMLLAFGADARILPPFLSNIPVQIGPAFVLPHQILMVVVAAVMALSLWLMLKMTVFGKALVACAESKEGAAVVGISSLRMQRATLLLVAGIGAIAGAVVAPIIPISFSSGLPLALMGFVAAALGLWTFGGAVIAGLLLGWLQAFGAGYVSSAFQDIFAYVALLVALVVATLPGSPAFIRRKLNTA